MIPRLNAPNLIFPCAGALAPLEVSNAPVLFGGGWFDGNVISPLLGVTIKSFHRWFILVTKWFCRQLGGWGS
jgi:hypothetical protein